jgi:competence CoiA-like predicted nuclease
VSWQARDRSGELSDVTTKNQTGKRYMCPVCGAEVVVPRAGKDQKQPLTCHDRPMEPKQQG